MSTPAVETADRTSGGTWLRLVPPLDLPAIAAWLLPFSLVVVLAFAGGGYDQVVRGELGIGVWWLVGVGTLTGAVSLRFGRGGRVALGLLGAFAAWTTLALLWTDSSERTVAEVARMITYVGILVLALSTQGRSGVRHAVNGAGSAVAVVAAAAVLSRLHPEWFPNEALYDVFPATRNRLAYPLGYWNLLAGLVVMGLPLLLAMAAYGRTVLMRSVSLAAVPVIGLCVYLAVSRGALIALVLSCLAWLLLASNRLPKLLQLLTAGVGTAVLCIAADARDALQENLGNAAHLREGDELLLLVVLVCGGVGLVGAALALADRHATRPRWMQPSRRLVAGLFSGAAVVLVLGFFAAGGAGWAQNRWNNFKGGAQPAVITGDDAIARLRSIDSNGRYQYWKLAVQSVESSSLGTGPGTFEYLWSKDGNAAAGGFIRDAHSLWFQALAETGIVGMLLVVAFFLAVLGIGSVRALRSEDLDHRAGLAGAVAGLVAFVSCASIEWAWQMTVLPAVALVLAAVAVSGTADRWLRTDRDRHRQRLRPLAVRIAVAVVSVAAVVVVALPMAGAADLRDSQRLAAAGQLDAALQSARDASSAQPYSASALMQQALILERGGDTKSALTAVDRATTAEPTNWRTWLIRSEIEARAGETGPALRSYRRARSLNPRSLIFR